MKRIKRFIDVVVHLFKCNIECPHRLFEESYHGGCERWIFFVDRHSGHHVCPEKHIW